MLFIRNTQVRKLLTIAPYVTVLTAVFFDGVSTQMGFDASPYVVEGNRFTAPLVNSIGLWPTVAAMMVGFALLGLPLLRHPTHRPFPPLLTVLWLLFVWNTVVRVTVIDSNLDIVRSIYEQAAL